MADAWDALLTMPKAAEGYAQGQLETDPWSFASKGIGAAKYQFDNPWAQIAAQALQGLGVGATSQMAQNNYNENLSNAYTQMLSGLSSGQKLEDPEMQNALEPVRALYNVGLSRENYENKKQLAQEERQLANRMEYAKFAESLRGREESKGSKPASPETIERARGVIKALGIAKSDEEAVKVIPEGLSEQQIQDFVYKGEVRRMMDFMGGGVDKLPPKAYEKAGAAKSVEAKFEPILQKIDKVKAQLPKDEIGAMTMNEMLKRLPTSDAQDLFQNLSFLVMEYGATQQGRNFSDADRRSLEGFLSGSAPLATGELKKRIIRMSNTIKRDARSYLEALATTPQYGAAVGALLPTVPGETPLEDESGPSPQTQYDPATEAAIQKRMAEIAAGQG